MEMRFCRRWRKCTLRQRRKCSVAFEPLNTFIEQVGVHGMHVFAFTDVFEEEDGEFSSKVLAEFFEPHVDSASAIGGSELERFVVDGNLKCDEGLDDTHDGLFGESACFPRIDGVERETYTNGIGVAEGEIGQLLHLVRGPVAEVERAAVAGFKWIATVGDVGGVEEG